MLNLFPAIPRSVIIACFTGWWMLYLDAAFPMLDEFFSFSNFAEWTPTINRSETKIF